MGFSSFLRILYSLPPSFLNFYTKKWSPGPLQKICRKFFFTSGQCSHFPRKKFTRWLYFFCSVIQRNNGLIDVKFYFCGIPDCRLVRRLLRWISSRLTPKPTLFIRWTTDIDSPHEWTFSSKNFTWTPLTFLGFVGRIDVCGSTDEKSWFWCQTARNPTQKPSIQSIRRYTAKIKSDIWPTLVSLDNRAEKVQPLRKFFSRKMRTLSRSEKKFPTNFLKWGVPKLLEIFPTRRFLSICSKIVFLQKEHVSFGRLWVGLEVFEGIQLVERLGFVRNCEGI